MLAPHVLALLGITYVGKTTGLNVGVLWRSTAKVDVPCHQASTSSNTRKRDASSVAKLFNRHLLPRAPWRNPTDTEGSRRIPVFNRGGLRLRRLVGDRRWRQPRPVRDRGDTELSQMIAGRDANARRLDTVIVSINSTRTDPELVLAKSGAVVALPILSRLFAQASNLFQVGVLFGTIPTVLAAGVCCYWAWQVSDYLFRFLCKIRSGYRSINRQRSNDFTRHNRAAPSLCCCSLRW